MNDVTVQTSMVKIVENRLVTPLGKTITLPIQLDGKPSPIFIYVTTSAFQYEQPTDKVLQDIASEIAWRINRRLP